MKGWVRLVAKPYRMRKKLKTGEEKEYTGYRIILPRRLVEELGLEGEAPLVARLEVAEWYHLLDWTVPENKALWRRLPEKARLDLCSKKLAPEDLCTHTETLTILAKPGDLQQLGLDPSRPLTLEDLVEAIRRKLQAELQAQSPSPQ